jgi:hypothetical protein
MGGKTGSIDIETAQYSTAENKKSMFKVNAVNCPFKGGNLGR